MKSVREIDQSFLNGYHKISMTIEGSNLTLKFYNSATEEENQRLSLPEGLEYEASIQYPDRSCLLKDLQNLYRSV